MLAEFTLHTDLDQVVLKQNSIVLADKPETLVSRVNNHNFLIQVSFVM